MIGLFFMKNGRYIFSLLENKSVPWSQNAVKLSDSTRPTDMKILPSHKVIIFYLMGDFTTRKSSNEHGFSVAVTSFKKISEGRIRDHTGNVSFPVTFKCIMLFAVASLNNIGEGKIRDHTDPPQPLRYHLWREALTSYVVADRTNLLLPFYFNECSDRLPQVEGDSGVNIVNITEACEKRKPGVKFRKDRNMSRYWNSSAGLNTWTHVQWLKREAHRKLASELRT